MPTLQDRITRLDAVTAEIQLLRHQLPQLVQERDILTAEIRLEIARSSPNQAVYHAPTQQFYELGASDGLARMPVPNAASIRLSELCDQEDDCGAEEFDPNDIISIPREALEAAMDLDEDEDEDIAAAAAWAKACPVARHAEGQAVS